MKPPLSPDGIALEGPQQEGCISIYIPPPSIEPFNTSPYPLVIANLPVLSADFIPQQEEEEHRAVASVLSAENGDDAAVALYERCV
jgi:hypothetical protein